MATNALRTYVARSGTSATNTTRVALVAATARTVVAVLGASSDTLGLVRVKVSFNSATAADAPALVEVGLITALGTMTSFTPVQQSGMTAASSSSGGYNATVEPTYSKIFDSFDLPVFNGSYAEWTPLGFEANAGTSQGFGIRITSPQAASVLCGLFYGE